MALEVDPAVTSRVQLEPYARALIRKGNRAEDVEAIRVELASRVWQNVNPYLAGEAYRAYRSNQTEPPPGAPLPATRP